MRETLLAFPAILSGWLIWIVAFKYVFGFGWPHEWSGPRP